jgi:hypothetical protein
MRMVIEGVEVPEACELSAELKRAASEVYDAGPPALDADELQLRRSAKAGGNLVEADNNLAEINP